MGEEAESVLLSTGCTADERKVYETVVTELDDYFKVRRNTILERAKFNKRNQREGEPIEQYITALYDLAEFCGYGALKEDLMRDRLVVGILDQALSERLQTDSDLTLERAKTLVRQKAVVKEQNHELREAELEATLGEFAHARATSLDLRLNLVSSPTKVQHVGGVLSVRKAWVRVGQPRFARATNY